MWGSNKEQLQLSRSLSDKRFYATKDDILTILQSLLLLALVNYLTHFQLAALYPLHTQFMSTVNYSSSHS